MTTTFDQLATRILDGSAATEADALAVLRAHDDELLDVVAAAGRLRRAHFGNTVKVNYLVNLKSGLCPENCNYCSQALGSTAPILKYSWLKTDEALEQAGGRAQRRRHPGLHGRPAAAARRDRDIDKVTEMVGAHQGREPRRRGLRLPRPAQGRPGRAAQGRRRRRLQPQHQHRRVAPRQRSCRRTRTPTASTPSTKAKTAGLSPCSGLIAGLGETDEQLVEALFALRELESDSIPVNFLMPFDGTPVREHVGARPQPLPEDPRDGALRVPRHARSGSPAVARCTCARSRASRSTSPTRSSSATTSPPRARPPRPTSR